MEKWKVFTLNGEENNCKKSDIIVTIEEKTEAEKDFSKVMDHYDEGCKKME